LKRPSWVRFAALHIYKERQGSKFTAEERRGSIGVGEADVEKEEDEDEGEQLGLLKVEPRMHTDKHGFHRRERR
jgi:hypothetical protein